MFKGKNDALFKAAKKGDVAAIEKAVHDGANVHGRRFWQFNETPLHTAAKHGHPDAINMLIRLGADVHAKSK